jgi:MoxR-like ATPase
MTESTAVSLEARDREMQLLHEYLLGNRIVSVVGAAGVGKTHLADAAADLIDTISTSCPALTVLTTSRVPLSVAGEQVMMLDPSRSTVWRPSCSGILLRNTTATINARTTAQTAGTPVPFYITSV